MRKSYCYDGETVSNDEESFKLFCQSEERCTDRLPRYWVAFAHSEEQRRIATLLRHPESLDIKF